MTKLNFKKTLVCISSIAVIAVGLNACSPKKDDNGTRILHIGNQGEPISLDPHQASGSWENRILNELFTGLTAHDAKGEIIPGMAKDWTTSSDGLVWKFNLREAKWSDGVPVTANDFVYAWHKLFTSSPPAKYASLLYVVKNSEDIYTGKIKDVTQLGIKAIDDKTLEITLNHPAPYLPELLSHYVTFPIPKHSVEKLGKSWVKPENMVSNGAFTLSEWAPNDYVRVVKNPNFYEASSVCLNEMYFYPTQDDNAAERRVRTGHLDVQTNFAGTRLEEINRTLPGYARIHPYITTNYFIFNTKKAPFDNEKVREALSIALNREFITDKILQGGQIPAYSLVPPNVHGYKSGQVNSDFKDIPYPERLAKAKKLLEEAGFGPNKPLVFTFSHRNTGDNPKIAPVVRQNWADIAPWVQPSVLGNDVQIHYEKLRNGDYEASDMAWNADYNDARSFLYNFETATGDMNYSKFSDAEFDNLVKQSDNEKDINKRASLMAKAEKIILDKDALAPVFFYTTRNLVNPRITGWVDNVSDYHRGRYLCTIEAQAEDKAKK